MPFIRFWLFISGTKLGSQEDSSRDSEWRMGRLWRPWRQICWLPGTGIIYFCVGLLGWSLWHANVTWVSRLGCVLLPDTVFPDSIWVKVHKGFLPLGTQAGVYLPSLRKFSFLWVGGSGRSETGVCWMLWAVPREEEQEEDQECFKLNLIGNVCSPEHRLVHPSHLPIMWEVTGYKSKYQRTWVMGATQ